MAGLAELKGKVAIVTGGASGIGKGIARQLAAQGMQTVIADIEKSALDNTADELGVTGIVTDVSSMDSMQSLASQVLKQFGSVHLVCNNAGVGSVARIADMTPDDWEWLLNVNLRGVINGVSVFLPILKQNAEAGHIVNTASMGGLATLPGLGGYAVTKFGVVALTETLAEELAEEHSPVGVTLLCPGPVRSNIKDSMRNRSADLADRGLVDTDLESSPHGAQMRWLDPEQVGDIVVRAVNNGDLYAFTHPEMAAIPAARHDRIAAAFASAAAGSE